MEPSVPSPTTCIICFGGFKTKYRAVFCPDQHTICRSGVPSYLSQMFLNPEANIPAKGSICSKQIKFGVLEKVLSDEQFFKYNNYLALNQIVEEDVKICGPSCDYFEVWSKDDESTLFYCKNQNGRKGTCLAGKCNFIFPKDANNITILERVNIYIKGGSNAHFNGAKYMDYVQDITNILENLNGRFCPKCGSGGRKDDKCTQIIGDKGNNRFGYFGGVSGDETDKLDPRGSLYGHNHNWETNKKRCPLYLDTIWKIDPRWPKSDIDCLDFFHTLLTYSKLKDYIEEIGQETFKEIYRKFDVFKSYGIDINDVFNMDLTLIHRKTK